MGEVRIISLGAIGHIVRGIGSQVQAFFVVHDPKSTSQSTMKPERILTVSESRRALLSNRVTNQRRVLGVPATESTGRLQLPKTPREERIDKFKSRQLENSKPPKRHSFKVDKIEKESSNGSNCLAPLFCTRKSTSQKETKNMLKDVNNMKAENETLRKENSTVKKKLGEIERTLTQKDHWISSLEKRLYGNADLTETKHRINADLVSISDNEKTTKRKNVRDAGTNTDNIYDEDEPKLISPTIKIMSKKGSEMDSTQVPTSSSRVNGNEQDRGSKTNPQSSRNKTNSTLDAVDLIDLESSVGNCPSSSSSSTMMQDLEKQSLEKQLQLQKEENTRLLSKILRLQGNIQVCCRIRPMNADETYSKERVTVEPRSGTEVVCYDDKINAWRSFVFDKVWGPDKSQEQVFADVEPYALSVVDGYNSCIFAYGETGSGKTYTMEGRSQHNQFGISYRIIQKILRLLEERKEKDARYEFSVEMSMLEIYNEEIYDLLQNDSSRSAEGSYRRYNRGLSIRRGSDSMIEAIDLKKEKVFCVEDVISILSRGKSNRAAAATNMNEYSSRSHMALNVRVTAGLKDQLQSTGDLFLVDLAGSERIHQNGVDGNEIKEARLINKSLSALGNVMEALDQKSSHVPYRNSKLTHLLQDALSGNSKTMMLVNLSPTYVSKESNSTLQFAMRARRINLGAAQQNAKSKNLEETVNSLRMQVDLLTQAKKVKEDDNIKLKSALDRSQERLKKFQKEKEKAFEVIQIATRARKVNQGIAEQNVKTKNLEETVRNYKRQTRALTEAKKAKDDEIIELRKSLKRTQEKLEKMQDERTRDVMKSKPMVESRYNHTDSPKPASAKGSVRSDYHEEEISRLKKRLSSLANKGSGGSLKHEPEKDFLLQDEKLSVDNSLSVYTTSVASTPQKPQAVKYKSDASQSSFNDVVNSCQDTRNKILVLLNEHYPKKVDKIDLLLEKTQGDEKKLLERIIDHIKKDGKRNLKEVTSCARSSVSTSSGARQIL